jgi:hypothetical protein
MDNMWSFFHEWDSLEAQHPFGVMYFRPLFSRFGISETLAGDVDEFLFLDLMPPRIAHVRRIKVQTRITSEVFWVYLDLRTAIISFQSTPAAPFTFSVTITLEPICVVGTILAYFRRLENMKPPTIQRHRNFNAYLKRTQ